MRSQNKVEQEPCPLCGGAKRKAEWYCDQCAAYQAKARARNYESETGKVQRLGEEMEKQY